MLGDIQTNYLYEPKVFGKGPRGEDELMRLTYEEDLPLLEKYEDILKRGETMQKYCVYSNIVQIWDNSEMFNKLFPILLKRVIHERNDVSILAAESFHDLLEKRIIPTLKQLASLEGKEKLILKNIEKTIANSLALDGQELDDKEEKKDSPMIKNMRVQRLMTLQTAETEGGDKKNITRSHKKRRRSLSQKKSTETLTKKINDLSKQLDETKSLIAKQKIELKKIDSTKDDLIRCGLSMIRSESMQVVKSWLPFVLEYFKYFGLNQNLKLELIKLVYKMMGKIEYDFTQMAGICLWSFMFEASIVYFGENELEIFNHLFNSKEDLVVETMITIFSPSVIMKLKNLEYKSIMVELVIDNLLSNSDMIKVQALNYLLNIFEHLNPDQKMRVVKFCSKVKHTLEYEYMLTLIPKILVVVLKDDTVGFSKSRFFIDFIKRLKRCKEHPLKIGFIDCILKILEMKDGVKICQKHFRNEIIEYFDFDEDKQVHCDKQNEEYEGYMDEIDVLCHLIENLDKITILLKEDDINAVKLLELLIKINNINVISQFCKKVLTFFEIEGFFKSYKLREPTDINAHFEIMNLLRKIWAKGIELGLQWRYEINIIHILQRIHIDNFIFPLLCEGSKLNPVLVSELDSVNNYTVSLHYFLLKRLKKSNNEVSKKLAELIIWNCSSTLKELNKNEFKKSFEGLLKSSSYSYRMKIVILIEAGTSILSPSSFSFFFHKCFEILENECCETIARLFFKLKHKLAQISCLHQEIENKLLNLSSSFRAKFHTKKNMKQQSTEFGDFIRERALDNEFIKKSRVLYTKATKREERIRKKAKLLLVTKNLGKDPRRRSVSSANRLKRRRNPNKTGSLIRRERSRKREGSNKKIMIGKSKGDKKVVVNKRGSKFILKQVSKIKSNTHVDSSFQNDSNLGNTPVFTRPPIKKNPRRSIKSSKRIPTPKKPLIELEVNTEAKIYQKYSRKQKLKKIKTISDFSKIRPKVVSRQRKVLRGKNSKDGSISINEYNLLKKINRSKSKHIVENKFRQKLDRLKYGYSEKVPTQFSQLSRSSSKVVSDSKKKSRSLSVKIKLESGFAQS